MKYWYKLGTLRRLAEKLHLYFHKISNSALINKRSKVDHTPSYLEGVFAYFDKRLDDLEQDKEMKILVRKEVLDIRNLVTKLQRADSFNKTIKELTKQVKYLHMELEELREIKGGKRWKKKIKE